MKKILVSGYFAKNFGDDLFFKILFDRYKNEDIQWTVDTGYKEYSKIFGEYENVIVRNSVYHKVINKLNLQQLVYKKLDAAVFIGGSIFMEHNSWKNKYVYKNKIIEKIRSENVFFIGCNFGPFNTTEYFEKNKNLLEKSTDVCFRDTYSYDLFSELSNVRLASDIVFGLKTKEIKKKNNTLGISVIDLNDKDDLKEYEESYLERMTKIITEAVDKGIEVTLFSFCEAQGDMVTCKKIIDMLEADYAKTVKVANYDGNIESFLNIFGSMENIVGTRFHACVLSQVFNQGLYPIIYSNKTYNMLKDINLINLYTYVKDIENLNPSHILNEISLNRLTNTYPFHDAEKHFEVLDKYVK